MGVKFQVESFGVAVTLLHRSVIWFKREHVYLSRLARNKKQDPAAAMLHDDFKVAFLISDLHHWYHRERFALFDPNAVTLGL